MRKLTGTALAVLLSSSCQYDNQFGAQDLLNCLSDDDCESPQHCLGLAVLAEEDPPRPCAQDGYLGLDTGDDQTTQPGDESSIFYLCSDQRRFAPVCTAVDSIICGQQRCNVGQYCAMYPVVDDQDLVGDLFCVTAPTSASSPDAWRQCTTDDGCGSEHCKRLLFNDGNRIDFYVNVCVDDESGEIQSVPQT